MSGLNATFRVGPDGIFYKAWNLERASGNALGTVNSVEAKLLDADGTTVTGSDATLTDPDGDGVYKGTSGSVTLDKKAYYQAQIKVTMADGTPGTDHSPLRQPSW